MHSFLILFIKQKLNRGRAANSDHFTVNKKSEYAPVLNDPEAYGEFALTPDLNHREPANVSTNIHCRVHSDYSEGPLI